MPPESHSDSTETPAGAGDGVESFDLDPIRARGKCSLSLVAGSPTSRDQAVASFGRFTCRSLQRQQLLVVAFLSLLLTLVRSSETVQNRHNENSIYQHHDIEEYYFRCEINFLVGQSMVLGNYFGAVVEGKSVEDRERDGISRLFLEDSIQRELDYVRRLKSKMGKKYDHSKKSSGSISGDTKLDDGGGEFVSSVTNCTLTEAVKTGNPFHNDMLETITSTIIAATWPNWAPAFSPIEEITINHKYDFDWLVEYGFAWMHENLGCREHAYNQNKPLYTPDMWRKLWCAFQGSTLFPFQIPNLDESPREPFYVGKTTDGKGRGNFASRNIAKGSLIHSGHPNTVFFLECYSWYRFVEKLPKMLACDVMEWAWQQDLTDSGNVVLCLNLDKAVFFNDGGSNESINMEMKERWALEFYATGNIRKDEELLYDYAHFEFDTIEMGL